MYFRMLRRVLIFWITEFMLLDNQGDLCGHANSGIALVQAVAGVFTDVVGALGIYKPNTVLIFFKGGHNVFGIGVFVGDVGFAGDLKAVFLPSSSMFRTSLPPTIMIAVLMPSSSFWKESHRAKPQMPTIRTSMPIINFISFLVLLGLFIKKLLLYTKSLPDYCTLFGASCNLWGKSLQK